MVEFEDIKQHMKLSKEIRQDHLDLREKCVEIGGDSRDFRGLLAHFLKTTLPSGWSVHLCHACHNGECSNLRHLYWGTVSENTQDTIAAGRKIKSKNFTHAGHKHTDEQKRKWSQERKGKNHSCANTIYVNDGVVVRRIKQGTPIPVGFQIGRKYHG